MSDKFCGLLIVVLCVVFTVAFLTCACDSSEDNWYKPASEFLFKHPEISFQLNKDGEKYDKYAGRDVLNNYDYNQQIVTFFIGTDQYELLMAYKDQRIGETEYFVTALRHTNGMWFKKAQNLQPKAKPANTNDINNKSKKQKEGGMDLTLGTWILLILVIIIVTKIAHKLSLKTIFRPVKKSTQKVKKEWKES